MELICKKADVWNCDVSKIGTIGFSAGEHLAASYAVKYDCKEVREHFSESKAVNAQVLCKGIVRA